MSELLGNLIIHKHSKYYPVKAEYAWQLQRGLQQSPLYISRDRMIATAMAQWNITWQGTVGEPGDVLQGEVLTGYRLCRCDVIVEITLTYPRWRPTPQRGKGCFRRWRRYRLVKQWRHSFTAIRRHEEGYAEIAIDAARGMCSQLAEIPDQPDHETLTAAVNRLRRRVIRECRNEQQKYDRRTRHGFFQGVSLNSHWFITDVTQAREGAG